MLAFGIFSNNGWFNLIFFPYEIIYRLYYKTTLFTIPTPNLTSDEHIKRNCILQRPTVLQDICK